jgi:predicted nucleic acid-binding Zn ribbon protein
MRNGKKAAVQAAGEPKNCANCHRPILNPRANKKYCSDKCGQKIRYLNWELKTHPGRVASRNEQKRCLCCGAALPTPHRADKLYCNPKHSWLAWERKLHPGRKKRIAGRDARATPAA